MPKSFTSEKQNCSCVEHYISCVPYTKVTRHFPETVWKNSQVVPDGCFSSSWETTKKDKNYIRNEKKHRACYDLKKRNHKSYAYKLRNIILCILGTFLRARRMLLISGESGERKPQNKHFKRKVNIAKLRISLSEEASLSATADFGSFYYPAAFSKHFCGVCQSGEPFTTSRNLSFTGFAKSQGGATCFCGNKMASFVSGRAVVRCGPSYPPGTNPTGCKYPQCAS